ncbi:MAG: hypothetical protein WA440_00755 [Ignavibacteriaceae bacterium]|nr:hypothetical protein [Ignavibacteriaceae bacterium]
MTRRESKIKFTKNAQSKLLLCYIVKLPVMKPALAAGISGNTFII